MNLSRAGYRFEKIFNYLIAEPYSITLPIFSEGYENSAPFIMIERITELLLEIYNEAAFFPYLAPLHTPFVAAYQDNNISLNIAH